MVNSKKVRNRVFFLIRLLLVLSIFTNLIIMSLVILQNENTRTVEIANEITKRIQFIFWSILTLILTFGSDYIEKKEQIDIPDMLEIVIVVFIYAGLYLSARFNLYYKYFWWDDLLHTISGIIIGFIGSIVIYKINYKYSMDISPLLVALFSFTFAVTLGVIWEILEFTSDVLLGTANQKWDLPDTEILLGKPYQGSGLRDTMSDLIVDSLGALFTSIVTFFLFKNKKKRMLKEIENILEGK